jgi:hypothetical protein
MMGTQWEHIKNRQQQKKIKITPIAQNPKEKKLSPLSAC